MPHPLHSANRLKLGIMAFNCSHGSTVTTAAGAWDLNWADSVKLAQMADAAGMETLLPVGRWKGYGGATNFNGQSFEAFTWAAGLGASTQRISVIATVHAPMVHPVMAAKQAATVDHITGGRFVLNLVCGWNKPEFEMFGVEMRDHERRYDYAAEWLALVRRLWTDTTPFDHAGEFFQGRALWSMPKPVQGGQLVVMNAGSSAYRTSLLGDALRHEFRHVAPEERRDRCRPDRPLEGDGGRGRAHVAVLDSRLCGLPADREGGARLLHHYVVEKGDDAAAENMLDIFGMNSKTLQASDIEAFKFHFKAGHGGYPLVGTPEQIVEQMRQLSAMGVDGILLSWVDYLAEGRQWIDEVMPLMVQAGLREGDADQRDRAETIDPRKASPMPDLVIPFNATRLTSRIGEIVAVVDGAGALVYLDFEEKTGPTPAPGPADWRGHPVDCGASAG